MATDNPFDSPMASGTGTLTQPVTRNQQSRLPILVGVLAGMVISFVLLEIFETSLSILIFGQPPGKQVWAMPGYYCIHRTLLLLTCSVGGAVGICFSSMRKRNAILFLSAIIGIVAVFGALSPR